MPTSYQWRYAATAIVAVLITVAVSQAQSISGTVVDPTGAVVPKATVDIHNPVSHYDRSAVTDASGRFMFTNVPLNPYHLSVSAAGFAAYAQDVEIRSNVPLEIPIKLQVSGSSTSITVEAAGDLLENDSTSHTDIDKNMSDRIPLESQSSSLSSLVTLASPGISADSNGLFHGFGDHAENSFSIDGQPVTDQVSKVFSNQVPVDSIQSLEVIAGAPPAEYGGKTSVVVVATTRSGQGMTKPHGELTASYGTFGSSNLGFNLGYGAKTWGNYVSANGLDTGRFLDPPEFVVFHDKGNEENFFDRVDYQPSEKDSFQLNLGFTRSWFQTPNTYDQQLQTCTVLSSDCNASGTTVLNPVTGALLGSTDQRSQIRSFNIAPSWTHVLNANDVVNVGLFVRHDQYNYYPSNNYYSDLGPLQDETVGQLRFLTNAGIRTSWSRVKGIQNLKIGGTFEHTFLTENDTFGIINPGLLSSVGCPTGTPPVTTEECDALEPLNLATGGSLYTYRGHTDVKELALYAQDTINKGPWNAYFGLRGDVYNGLDASSGQIEPRAGVAYNIHRSNTVLRISYARTMESPFNENLVLTGTGCSNDVVEAIMVVAQLLACNTSPLRPGFRNEFHAGFEQAAGKHLVISGEYIWKYTHNGYDFNVFGTTPITLPIEWHNSKIPGFALRTSVPEYHGFTAFVVMSSVAARFNPPTVSGIAPPAPPAWFRIDHDERFNETTHLQYQPWKRGPWMGFNWRFDSGLVAGATPCEAQTATCSFSTSPNDPGINGLPPSGVAPAAVPAGYIYLVNSVNGLPLTADQEFQSGLTCAGVRATPTTYIGNVVPGEPARDCLATQLTSSLIKIPAPNTEQDDHNPQRIQPRNLFDMSVGHDNLFHTEKYKVSLQLTAINLTNKYALYNFLSTFSGTHYVTPRTLTAEVGFHF